MYLNLLLANMSEELLRKKLNRTKKQVAQLEEIIESKTRDLFVANKKQSEVVEYLNGIMDSMSSCLLIVNKDQKVTLVNNQTLHLLLYDRGDVLGLPISNFVEKTETSSANQRSNQSFYSEQPFTSFEGKLIAKNGIKIPVFVTSSEFKNSRSDEKQTIYTTIDITEKKEAEKQLSELNKKLIKTSRDAGMAEIATNILHNVGNVLTSINISANVIEERLRKSKLSSLEKLSDLLSKNQENFIDFVTNQKQGKMLPSFVQQLAARLKEEKQEVEKEIVLLKENIDHVKQIVSMQQSYAKKSGIVENVDVEDLLESALRIAEDKIVSGGIKINKSYHGVSSIKVDRHKALQILVNLVSNAVASTLERNPEDKLIDIMIKDFELSFKISVKDFGIGISKENQNKIFQHGFTTKEEGHGFGLHASANAARQMGGELSFTSAGEGKGATFTLELPYEPPTYRSSHVSTAI